MTARATKKMAPEGAIFQVEYFIPNAATPLGRRERTKGYRFDLSIFFEPSVRRISNPSLPTITPLGRTS